MQFNQELTSASYTIRSYSDGKISISAPVTQTSTNLQDQISYDVITTSFIMTPNQLIRNWPPQSVAEICAEHLTLIAELDPEVVLLGTGDTLEFPDMKLTYRLMEQGIGVEVMDSAAACRTYNVLMLEGRRVAIALVV